MQNPFNNINPDDLLKQQEEQYEEKIVGHLLAYYNLSRFKSELRRANNAATGSSLLTVSAMLDKFSSYPVMLSVCKQRGVVKNCTVDRLFNKMSTRRIVEHYLTAKEESTDDQGRAFALIFPWTFIPKGMVLHNRRVTLDEVPQTYKKPCVRLVWTLPKKYRKHGKYLTLEPLDQFLASFQWQYSEE